jgi:hypothetical protein
MKKIITALMATLTLTASSPVIADPLKDEDYFTMHSMGCMLLQECTDDVREVFSLLDVSSQYDNTESFTPVANEFNNMLVSLNQVGVNVYLADEKYFPVGHRGVYHTVSNNFFLNRRFMNRPGTLMSVMRHEGWHVAQDCMAGTIDNSLIAIIKPEDQVPSLWREIVERTYPPSARPWEAEATWAGKTEGMTMAALDACATGSMWNVYPPTPLTREYLVKEGYIK